MRRHMAENIALHLSYLVCVSAFTWFHGSNGEYLFVLLMGLLMPGLFFSVLTLELISVFLFI